jgi:hypothetical protein
VSHSGADVKSNESFFVMPLEGLRKNWHGISVMCWRYSFDTQCQSDCLAALCNCLVQSPLKFNGKGLKICIYR